jgi:tetratricopeptide (TPR) repeat protein
MKRITKPRPFYASFAVHLALITVIGLICYSNTFSASFHLDDYFNIVTNSNIRGFDYFAAHPFSNRSVGYLTFALNYRLHGMDVRGYHIANLSVHVLNAFLAYFIVVLTLTLRGGTANVASPRFTALLAGLLFVSHPIQTQAVTYVVQRFASLATLFFLVSLFAYIKSRISERIVPRLSFYALFLVSALLAVKTKENAVSLPIIIMVYEFMFFRERIEKRALYLLPMLLSAVLVPVFFLDIRIEEEVALSGSGYLFTQFRVVVTYIRLLVLPINQNFDYDFPLHHSGFDLPVVLSFVFLLGIFALGIYLLYRSRTTDYGFRLASFGVFWFFITLAPESSVVPLKDVIFEHRVYLPSVGAFSAVSAGLVMFIGRLGKRSLAVAVSIVAMVLLVFTGAAYSRNCVWKDEITLWRDVIVKSPEKARGYHNLGSAYRLGGQNDKAIEYYREALKLDPWFYQTHYQLGIAYRDKRMLDKAIWHYWNAIGIKPEYADAHLFLGEAYELKGFLEDAASEYRATLELIPGLREAKEGLARVNKELQISHDLLEYDYNSGLPAGN